MSGADITRGRATLIGFSAIGLWSLLAWLTVVTAPVPPFLLTALCFAIGGGIGLGWILATGTVHLLRGVGWRVYAFGTAGLFGYHALFFTAFRWAPLPETGLIAELWALFIVLFSGLLPGERLRPLHVVGAALAFVGAALIVLQDGGSVDGTALPGLALAFLCALTWAGYSVGSRLMGAVPTQAVVVFCLATAALSGAVHLLLERTVWPDSAAGWAAIAALGAGPVGLAFFTWDIGMKRGDIQLLGVASYAIPLLSTLILIAAGIGQATPALFAAAALIGGGAALAARASAGPVSRATGA